MKKRVVVLLMLIAVAILGFTINTYNAGRKCTVLVNAVRVKIASIVNTALKTEVAAEFVSNIVLTQ